VKLVRADGTLVQMNPSGLAMIGAARAEDDERICRGEDAELK
jgi:hypothetical protein